MLKSKIKILYFLITICLFIGCNQTDESRIKIINKQVGTYSLDLKKTTLDGYITDSNLYKNLEITFQKDLTFSLNMKVPFIYDSIGTWTPSKGGVEDWNWLYYKNNPKISTQFTSPWTSDSIFYLNSATPQKGRESIREIYFRKRVTSH